MNNFIKFKETIQSMGGHLLADSWLGNEVKYLIRLDNGKEFLQTPKKIKEVGFPIKLKNYQTLSLKEKDDIYFSAQKNIIKNGGIMNSINYYGVNEKYEFTDEFGKTFTSTMRKIANGYWNSSQKSFFVFEEYCRNMINHLTFNEFYNTRQILTPAVTGRSHALELDGYCEELKIAFEYQGHRSHWDEKNNKYEEVSEKDKLKVEYCKNLGIDLIVINYVKSDSKNNLKYLYKFIR